ncbi:MAG: 16S rRNA processing protein RimM [Bacilli bacterium]|nr:16S rRNA processing protein RimM [Bacilli bacterium]
MDFIYIGKLINTHALKGEVRIISDFEYKTLVFKKNNNLYIGEDKIKVTIETYRKHKNYDMVKFKEYNDILEVSVFKGKKVYALRDEIEFGDNILDSDLINLKCIYNNKEIGYVKEIINNNGYKLISLKEFLIPYHENFIENINLSRQEIIFKNLEGLINEN